MKIVYYSSLLIFISILFWCRCTKEEFVNDLGNSITIDFGKTIRIKDGQDNLTTKLIKVEDNRCPDCNICFSSTAIITLEVKKNDEEKFPIDLSILQCDEESGFSIALDTVGYHFELLNLKPYPTGDFISIDAYKAEIKVNKE